MQNTKLICIKSLTTSSAEGERKRGEEREKRKKGDRVFEHGKEKMIVTDFIIHSAFLFEPLVAEDMWGNCELRP